MKVVNSKTIQSADLGSTFISHKEVTISFNNEDLKKLLNVDMRLVGDFNHILGSDQIETLLELVECVTEEVSDYDLV